MLFRMNTSLAMLAAFFGYRPWNVFLLLIQLSGEQLAMTERKFQDNGLKTFSSYPSHRPRIPSSISFCIFSNFKHFWNFRNNLTNAHITRQIKHWFQPLLLEQTASACPPQTAEWVEASLSLTESRGNYSTEVQKAITAILNYHHHKQRSPKLL